MTYKEWAGADHPPHGMSRDFAAEREAEREQPSNAPTTTKTHHYHHYPFGDTRASCTHAYLDWSDVDDYEPGNRSVAIVPAASCEHDNDLEALVACNRVGFDCPVNQSEV